jgi:hypothetical protein
MLHEVLCTFTTVRSCVLIKARNVADKRRREIQNTHFMFDYFFPENRAVYEVMWNNNVEPDRPQITT